MAKHTQQNIEQVRLQSTHYLRIINKYPLKR